MKKVLFATIAFLLIAASAVRASNPIPSFNFPVTASTVFTEGVSGPIVNYNPKEKRDMNVTNGGGNSYVLVPQSITVYMFRLDMKKSYGPYTVYPGETLSVHIDNQEWAVLVMPSTPTVVSVWSTK